MDMVDRIRELSKAKGVSLTVIEKSLGFGNGTIGKWKSQDASSKKLLLVANFLQVSTDYLLTGKEITHQEAPQLSEDKQRLLKMYDNLTDMQKGELLGELKVTTRGRALQDTSDLDDAMELSDLVQADVTEFLQAKHKT